MSFNGIAFYLYPCYNDSATKGLGNTNAGGHLHRAPKRLRWCSPFVAERKVPCREGACLFMGRAEGSSTDVKCPKYQFEITDELKRTYCKNCDGCGENPRHPPSSAMLPPVDINKLAQGLAEKKANKVKLEICPHCGKKSWWLNPYTHKYECMNKQTCPTNSLSTFLTNHFRHSHIEDYPAENYTPKQYNASELSNPMLLSAKMFLADVIYIINRRYETGHVCADFAKEVRGAATQKGIRCGYTVISFKDSNIAHAIVAFQTDYGLKFFEPQNGNEMDVRVGYRYSAQLEGVPEENIINEIKIWWNDRTLTIIDD